MGNLATLETKRSPLAAMAERLSIDPTELQSIIKATVMPAKDSNKQPFIVTNEQLVSFMSVANAYGLDPLKREIFAFPGKGGGIQPIVSIDGWLSIINSHPQFDGMELVENFDEKKVLVSVTCTIYRKDRSRPTVVTELLKECKQNTDQWTNRPARMLRHKATIQCSRYAFGLGGIMDEDEGNYMEREVAPVYQQSTESSASAAPPEYSEADFAANLPKWRTLIEGGRKTPDQIIATVESKGLLSESQKDAVRNLVPIEVGGEFVDAAVEEFFNATA